MSYDFRMYVTAGSDEKIYTDLDLNYSYNVSNMFYKALFSFKDGIKTIHNMVGKYCSDGLMIGIIEMENNPDKYKTMNPTNGLGNYEGALSVLKVLYDYSTKYPEAIFEVS